MLTLLLTRHGHTVRSEPEQYLGQRIEALLSDRGRAEARALADRLEGVELQRIISSPLARSLESAQIIAGENPLETDARLAEMDYGRWEGLSVEQIKQRFAAEYARYEADPAGHQVGGGESGEQVAARVSSLISSLLDWWEGESAGADRTCLLVGHSSVNRVLLAACLGVPLPDYRRRFQQDWANLTVLHWPDRESGPLLLLANDMAHLRGLRGATWE